MRKFWGFYENDTYKVGCNGGTVYIYDKDDKELARFKDIAYAYNAEFKPNGNIIVVKSTEGSLAIYDLEKLELVKKIVITKIGAQDEGYCFTPDGKYFYNIEKPYDSTKTQMTVYNTTDFSVEKVLFSKRTDMHLEDIEFDGETGICYVLGFMRDSTGVFDYGFTGIYEDGEIKKIKKIEENIYDYLSHYKDWERAGFTEKSLQWSSLKEMKNIEKTSIKEIFGNS